jgi:hypothetical protein
MPSDPKTCDGCGRPRTWLVVWSGEDGDHELLLCEQCDADLVELIRERKGED